jgi:hypothetical protein
MRCTAESSFLRSRRRCRAAGPAARFGRAALGRRSLAAAGPTTCTTQIFMATTTLKSQPKRARSHTQLHARVPHLVEVPQPLDRHPAATWVTGQQRIAPLQTTPCPATANLGHRKSQTGHLNRLLKRVSTRGRHSHQCEIPSTATACSRVARYGRPRGFTHLAWAGTLSEGLQVEHIPGRQEPPDLPDEATEPLAPGPSQATARKPRALQRGRARCVPVRCAPGKPADKNGRIFRRVAADWPVRGTDRGGSGRYRGTVGRTLLTPRG